MHVGADYRCASVPVYATELPRIALDLAHSRKIRYPTKYASRASSCCKSGSRGHETSPVDGGGRIGDACGQHNRRTARARRGRRSHRPRSQGQRGATRRTAGSVGRPDQFAQAATRQEDRVTCRRTNRTTPRANGAMRTKEAGEKIGWAVTIIDGHGSPDLDRGLQPGDRAQGRRHRHRRRHRRACSSPSRKRRAAGHRGGRHPRLGVSRARTRSSGCLSTSSRTRATSAARRPTGSSSIPTARRASSSPATASTRSPAPRRTRPRRRIKECPGCEVLEFSNSPIAEVAQRQPPLVTAWVQKYGTPLYITSVADYTADYQIPALRAGGVEPGRRHPGLGRRQQIGLRAHPRRRPVPARDRVASPIKMQGYQAIDELNRAFHGQPPSRLRADALSGHAREHRRRRRRQEHLHPEQRLRAALLWRCGACSRRIGSWTSPPLRAMTEGPRCSRSAALTKRFAGTLALDGVDFEFARARSTRCWARTAPASRR